MCQAIHRYAKANNKYMENYDISIKSSYIEYLDANDLYRWPMSETLPVDGFKWVKKLSKFNDDFIKNYNENSDIRYFPEVYVKYLKELSNLHKDLPILQKRKKLINVKSLFVYRRQRKICCPHKSFKTSTKSWFKTKKGTQSNSI